MQSAIALTFFSAGHHLSLLLRSKRTLAVLLIVALAPILSAVAIDPERPMRHLIPVSLMLTLSILAPLAGLIMGSSVLSEDIEAKTLTYLFTRPIPRASLFLGRWIACTLIVCSLLAIAAWLIGHPASSIHVPPDQLDTGGPATPVPEGFTGRFMLASAFAGAMYTTLAAGLSTWVRRPIVFGLGYAFVLEMVVANLPGSTQRMSMQYYLRGILLDGELGSFKRFNPIRKMEFLSLQDSVTRLSIAMVVLLVLGTVLIRRKQYLLSN
ncbi:MAG: ABC transporter permease subunit [Planctomycetes bacterium]|nr:ABC transporter permease subunit [Planctomycetota bacterium]